MTGLRVALATILLFPALLRTGGAVCLDTLPLAVLKAECPEPCCAPPEGCCPDERQPDRSSPADPALPTCCVGGFDLWYLATDAVEVPALLPAPALSYLQAAWSSSPGAAVRATTSQMQRPPPVELVGVVRLQV